MQDDGAYPAVRHLGAIVDSSADAIVSKDLNGVIQSWNRAAETMFGFSAAEAIGRSIRMVIPADRQAEEDEVLRRIRKGETVTHFETFRQRKDGILFPVSLTVSPIRDAGGAIIGASKIARDITERVRTDEALAEARRHQSELHRKLLTLVTASGSLLGSPDSGEVLAAILNLAAEVVTADGYGVWRFDPHRGSWLVAAPRGISEDLAQQVLSAHAGQPIAAIPFTDPIIAEDVQVSPMLHNRRDALRQEGIKSMLALPLTLGGAATASLVFYFRTPRTFTDLEVESARALGNIAAGALRTSDLYEERRLREHQALFLARSASALASSLDYRETLKTLVQLAVPRIADWRAVDMVTNGVSERLAVAHPKPRGVARAEEFPRKYPPQLDDPAGLPAVLRSGESLLVPEVTGQMLTSGARDPEHAQALVGLGIKSVMIVPLRMRRAVIGAITFV